MHLPDSDAPDPESLPPLLTILGPQALSKHVQGCNGKLSTPGFAAGGKRIQNLVRREKNVCGWAIHGAFCSVVFEALLVRDALCQNVPGQLLRPDFGGNGARAWR